MSFKEKMNPLEVFLALPHLPSFSTKDTNFKLMLNCLELFKLN